MRELFRKLQLVAAVALGSVPVVLVLFTYTQPSLMPWAWVYSGAYMILVMLGIWIPGKRRLLYGIFAAAGSLVMTVLLAQRESLLPLLIADLFYLVLFEWSLTMSRWQTDRELPGLLRVVCFGFHLLAQFVVMADGLEPQPVLISQVPGLQCAFWAFLFLTVLSLNRVSMNKASTVSQRVSLGMRRKNTVMTLVLFALGILASFIPSIYGWMKTLILWLVGTLLHLLSFFAPEQQSGGAPAPESSSGEMLAVEETPPGPLSQIMEIVLLVIGGLLLVGICVFLVYWIGRKLVGLTQHIWAALERYAAAVSEDYQDEITDTRQESSEKRVTKGRHSGIRQNDRKGPMGPGEAIRYRYRRLLRKHPEWAASTTARENLPLGWAELYEQARYSDRTITESDAERFQSGTKRL